MRRPPATLSCGRLPEIGEDSRVDTRWVNPVSTERPPRHAGKVGRRGCRSTAPSVAARPGVDLGTFRGSKRRYLADPARGVWRRQRGADGTGRRASVTPRRTGGSRGSRGTDWRIGNPAGIVRDRVAAECVSAGGNLSVGSPGRGTSASRRVVKILAGPKVWEHPLSGHAVFCLDSANPW
jgi:hypothetical protein